MFRKKAVDRRGKAFSMFARHFSCFNICIAELDPLFFWPASSHISSRSQKLAFLLDSPTMFQSHVSIEDLEIIGEVIQFLMRSFRVSNLFSWAKVLSRIYTFWAFSFICYVGFSDVKIQSLDPLVYA